MELENESAANGAVSAAQKTTGIRRRTALFVDFDNIYGGLQKQDPSAAEAFASNPTDWISWLETHPAPHDGALPYERAILLRRCYLNPAMFGRYRPYFVRAGFQVVDCPSLTAAGKNGADIQMVMDVLEALEHPTHFDEFVLFSGDSDFTPVLLRLRTYDRRTMILSAGLTAAAYRAASDVILTEEMFVEHGLQVRPDERNGDYVPAAPPPPSWTSRSPSFAETKRGEPDRAVLRVKALNEIKALVDASPYPVVSATVAQHLMDAFGTVLTSTQWDGTGGFKAFVDSLPERPFQVSWAVPGYFYDRSRHGEPLDRQPARRIAVGDEEMNAAARRIHEITDVPLLTPAQFSAVFRAIAAEVGAHGYTMTQTSRAVRDACRAAGTPVSRQDISFILKGVAYSGYNLVRGVDTGAADRIAEAFHDNLIVLCERGQLSLTPDERLQLDRWILEGSRDDE